MAGPVMLYTKNGSIPQAETDGTEGWIEAPDKPECPEGKEVVWLNWEWIIRDPKPQDREGYQWNWNHVEMAWLELPLNIKQESETETTLVTSFATNQSNVLTTDQISALTTDQFK
jgi:hypothetical protein